MWARIRFSWISSFSPDKCLDNILADRYYGNKSPKKTISLVETVCNLYEIETRYFPHRSLESVNYHVQWAWYAVSEVLNACPFWSLTSLYTWMSLKFKETFNVQFKFCCSLKIGVIVHNNPDAIWFTTWKYWELLGILLWKPVIPLWYLSGSFCTPGTFFCSSWFTIARYPLKKRLEQSVKM